MFPSVLSHCQSSAGYSPAGMRTLLHSPGYLAWILVLIVNEAVELN